MSAISLTFSLCLGATTSALAQTVSTNPAGGASSNQLEEIVVTAQKRSENLQDVPISVTALTPSMVKAAGVLTTADLSVVTPGLNVSQTTTAPLFFLRGVGTALSTVGDEGSVNVVVDGVPYTSLPGSILSLSSIERVEVLRGPQGTLFGRNADGGVINIVTHDPQQRPSGDFSVGYGDYNTVTTAGYITAGLAPGVAVNATVQYTRQGDGFGTDLVTGRDVDYTRDITLRGKLKLNPDDLTNIILAGDYFRSTGDLAIARHIVKGAIGVFGTTAPANFQDATENIQPSAAVDNYGGSLRIERKLPFAQLNSITAYRETKSYYAFDQDGEPVDLVNAYFHQLDHQFTEELQLVSRPESKIKWIAGGFYLKSLAAGDPIDIGGLAFAPLGGFQDRYGAIHTQSLATFGQVTVPIGDIVDLTAGLRYTSDRKTYDYFDSSPVTGVTPTVTNGKTFDKLTYRFSADHKFTSSLLGYASVSRGFKSGFFNVLDPTNPPILPETLNAYEVGLKSELFGRRLRLNVSAFDYDYTNIQVSQIVKGTSFFLNARYARIYGADVDFEARQSAFFTLAGGAELLHARYGSFPNAPNSQPSGVGGNIVTVENAKGNQLVRAPDAQFSLTPRFTIPSAIGPFTVSATYLYTAQFPWEVNNRLKQSPTNIVNGQIFWQATNIFGVRLWARNLTNENYYLQQSSSINDTGEPAPPRTFGGTLEAHF